MPSFTSLVGAPAPFDPARKLVTSPFFSPAILAGLRLAMGLSIFVALIASLVHREVADHNGERFFSFFTNLTGIGVAAYLLHAGWMGAAYAVHRRRRSSARYPLQRWPRTFQVLHMILLASIRTLPPIVTLVYWTLLAGDGSLATVFGRYSDVSLHLLNSVFALFEIMCTHTPLSTWFNIVFMLLILCGYLAVAYITHATQGFYTYSFLDPAKSKTRLAVTLVGIAVAEVVIFALVNGLVWLRVRFAPKPLDVVPDSPLDSEKSDEESLRKPQQ